jgi:hypothetical protein
MPKVASTPRSFAERLSNTSIENLEREQVRLISQLELLSSVQKQHILNENRAKALRLKLQSDLTRMFVIWTIAQATLVFFYIVLDMTASDPGFFIFTVAGLGFGLGGLFNRFVNPQV